MRPVIRPASPRRASRSRVAAPPASEPARRSALANLGALATASVLVALLPPRMAMSRECAGATLRMLEMRSDGIRLSATVTHPGASHAGFVRPPEGFSLQIVDAEDPTRVYVDVRIPAERFHTGPSATRYDGLGAFDGSIRLRDSRRQQDTVLIKLATGDPPSLPVPASAELRAFVSGGELCSRSCVSACERHGAQEALDCNPSAFYEPFGDYGFGQLIGDAAPPPGPRSPICGLDIRPGGARCDFLIDDHCLLPYPSSVFLDSDPTTPTGRRVHYDLGSLPANSAGKPIDPSDWNTLDGFSPGPMIEALFPDTGFPVDLVASGVAFHTGIAPSLGADHPTVLLRAKDGERVVHFAELDATTGDVRKKAMILRPAVRLDDATRYLVAIRDLVDTLGNPIRPRAAFRVLRDGIRGDQVVLACGRGCAAEIARRRPAMERVLRRLARHGVPREDLVLAWDFNTASTQALTAWMVSIRDQAAALGTPEFTITKQHDGGGAGFNANIWMRIEGTFQAPLFTTADAPGSRLNLVGGMPQQNGFATVPFVVDVPRIAVDDARSGGHPRSTEAARATLWGHGLLGDRYQLGTLSQLANLFNFVIAAVDMQGMSSPDVAASILPMVSDLSLFHRIPERLHQGFLNHLLLGRLLADPLEGFGSHPAFRLGTGGASVIDPTQVFYSGGSQGGIFGGVIMGVSDVFERGFLAVPASNYSTLLQRSIDFVPFGDLLRPNYPDALDAILLYPVIQQLWDRADPHGYLPHILPGDLSDPPRPHEVLLHMATYDSEVSNLGTEIQVRSLGIPQVAPVRRSFFGIPEMAAPFDGSALVEVDPGRGASRCHTLGTTDRGALCDADSDCPGTGDPATRTECASGIPPLENLPPAFNNGAHGSTGNLATAMQIDAFLRTDGRIEQFCTGTCDPD